MSLENQRNWLRLALLPGMQFGEFYRLLKTFGLPEEIFLQSLSSLMTVIPQTLAIEIKKGPSEEDEGKIEHLTHLLSVIPSSRLLIPTDQDYPFNFLSVTPSPLVVFAVGEVALLNRKSVTLVGSSHPSTEGEDTARAWAASLAHKDINLVEGDHRGIEAIALRSALKADPFSVTAISKDLLFENNNIQKLLFFVKKGLFLSPIANAEESWLMRQQLLVACAQHFVVIEASARSRVLSLVKEASDMGRDIMAVPGSIHSPLSKGCHKLIREGAKLVESVDEILAEMSN